MSNRLSLENLVTLRVQEAQQRQQQWQKRNEGRDQLRQENKEKIQLERKNLQLPAEQAMSEVIQPWWQSFVNSQMGNDLLQVLQAGSLPIDSLGKSSGLSSLALTKPVEFLWQRNEQDEGRIYQSQLRIFTLHQRLQTALTREIPAAQGIAANYLNRSLGLLVDFETGNNVSEVHPKVLLGVAQQIREGTIEEMLKSAFLR